MFVAGDPGHVDEHNRLTGQVVALVAAPGGVDDTALFTAAEAAMPDAGGTIILSAGEYVLPSGFSFSKPVRLVGQGMGSPYGYNDAGFDDAYPPSIDNRGLTSIIVDSTTVTALTFNHAGCGISDLTVVNISEEAPTAGAGVVLTDCSMFRMDRTGVIGFYDCVDVNNSGLMSICGSHIANAVRYGIRLRNTDVPDEGDHFIGAGTAIYAISRTGTAGINWESGGGLKLNGLKINGSSTSYWGSGVRFNLATIASSVGTITGCSIENCQVGIDFNRQGGSGTYGTVTIVGNEIGAGRSTSYGILLQSAGFEMIHISDNVIRAQTYGIQIVHGTGIYIGPNTYRSMGTECIRIGASVTSVTVAPQSVYEDDVIINDLSPSATLALIDYDYSRALGAVTSSDTTLWRLAVPTNNAGTIDFYVTGNAVGVGAFSFRCVRSYTRASGAVTVATVGTDSSVGAASTDVEVTFDTAAVSGEVQVKIKLASGATATDLDGVVNLKVAGRLSKLTRGA